MKQSTVRKLVLVCGIALIAAAGVCEQPKIKLASVQPTSQRSSRLPADKLAELSDSLQRLASKVSPAVVQIEVSGFGPSEESAGKNTALIMRQHAIGSGVIVDSDGYIMTNAHVVDGAQRIRVVISTSPAASGSVSSALFDRAETGQPQVLDAKVIGLQKDPDLALLKVEATNLPTLPFNLDRVPQPGELVFAIGSPQGLQSSVTMGIVSSAWRQPDPDNPMVYLQTDAPINPGNSGGPLVDVSGTVVGLNTFIYSNSGGNEGLGFAIPAPVVNFVYRSLRKLGYVEHVEIGVLAQTITPTMADGLGLAQRWGVVIVDLQPGGPAASAGIKQDDVVLAVDAHPVLNLTGFTAALFQHAPNQVVTIDVLRDKQRMSFKVPAVPGRDGMSQFADNVDPLKSHIAALAVVAVDFTADLRPMLPYARLGSGVIVVGRAPGFNSANTGLRPGDIIHALNRSSIDSVEQLKSAVAKLKAGDAAVLQIERQGQMQYLAFEME